MNPGPSEEIGKAAGLFMNIMREQPLALALVLCNLVLLALFFFVVNAATNTRATEMQLIFEAQKEVQQLLYSCVPAKG